MSSRITYITPSHTQVKDIIDRLKGDAFLSLNARVGDGAINTILQNLTTANRLRAVLTQNQTDAALQAPNRGAQYWNSLVNNKDLRFNPPDASQREDISGSQVFRRIRKCHELEQLYINKHFEVLGAFNTLLRLVTVFSNLITLIFIIITDLVRTDCDNDLETLNVPMSIIGNMKDLVGSQNEILNQLRAIIPDSVLRNKFSTPQTVNQNYGTGNLLDKNSRGTTSLRMKKRNNPSGRRQLGGTRTVEAAMDEDDGVLVLENEDYITRLSRFLDEMSTQMETIQTGIYSLIPTGGIETRFSRSKRVQPRADMDTAAWDSVSQSNRTLKFFDYERIARTAPETVPASFMRFMSNDPDRFNAADANQFSNNATGDQVTSFLEKCYELEIFYIKKHLELANIIDGLDNVEPELDEQNYTSVFNILVNCEDEQHQERVYNELLEKGYKCQVQSL